MKIKGCIHIYTGDGKGKTTAAAGLAVRASGSGLRVLFCQFLKGRPTGEIGPLRSLGVTVIRTNEVKKFIPDMNDEEKRTCMAAQRRCFDEMKKRAGEFDMVVLDEVFGAISTGMLDLGEVTAFCREKPEPLELVMTGREPPEDILALADYISEIHCLRHPYDKGVPARKGIEY